MASQGSGRNERYCEVCRGPCKLLGATAEQLNESQTDFKTIQWSSKNPKSSYELKQCYKNQKDTKILVDKGNWETELPELCKLLGLRCVANKDDVKAALDKAQAFQLSPGSLFQAAKYEYDVNKKVQYDVRVQENGKCNLKITIPAKYQSQLSNRSSDEFRELESYAKQELARAFGTPEDLLLPEISRLEIKQGSIVLVFALLAAALLLVLVGIGLTQTPEWNDHMFEILMAVGGAAVGTAIGVFGGPIGAGIGAMVGGIYGLGMAWAIKSGPKVIKCALAKLEFTASASGICIQLRLKFC